MAVKQVKKGNFLLFWNCDGFSDCRTVVDPGFPIGGMDLVGGAVDPQGGYVLKILHVKMKESGPVGGKCAGRTPLDPPMQNLHLADSYVSPNISLDTFGLVIRPVQTHPRIRLDCSPVWLVH